MVRDPCQDSAGRSKVRPAPPIRHRDPSLVPMSRKSCPSSLVSEMVDLVGTSLTAGVADFTLIVR